MIVQNRIKDLWWNIFFQKYCKLLSYRDCLEYKGEPRHLVAGHIEVRHVFTDGCYQVRQTRTGGGTPGACSRGLKLGIS